ncbi:MAG TPA: 2-dehydropantoate 2-reductase [Thermoplasmata archaeon]|nr:2-dehydropantoate 2-reductase [Thermoplasmata archaeon]
MKVLIFGAGAVGSVLGACLSRAGRDVTLVGRPPHMDAIRRSGLEVENLAGGPFRLPALDEVPESSEWDRIVLTTKANDIEEAGRALAHRTLHPVPVLAIQNGLGIRPRVRRALSSNGWAYANKWVTRGIGSVPATYLGPGRVRFAGEGEITLGDSGERGGLNGFDALLEGTGIRVRVVPSIDREEWKKALVNAAMNPVTADLRIENGRLSEDPYRGHALALLHEARSVAASEGFEFTEEEAERELWRICRATAPNHSSMWQDLELGRPTEIEAISGAILEIGARHGLPLPHTERAVRRIREKAATRRSPGGPPSAGAGA